jgi:hypothetical protein
VFPDQRACGSQIVSFRTVGNFSGISAIFISRMNRYMSPQNRGGPDGQEEKIGQEIIRKNADEEAQIDAHRCQTQENGKENIDDETRQETRETRRLRDDALRIFSLSGGPRGGPPDHRSGGFRKSRPSQPRIQDGARQRRGCCLRARHDGFRHHAAPCRRFPRTHRAPNPRRR